MPRRLFGLIASTCLVLGIGAAMPVAASAQEYSVSPFVVIGDAQYICDGSGAGSCVSLPKGGAIFPGANTFAIGFGNGAWRWDVYTVDYVGSNTFTYGPLDTALVNQPIFQIQLLDTSDGTYCLTNSDGGAIIKNCTPYSPSASQEWVADPQNDYLVNVGRSNDKDNWEVLCNPGSSNPLTVTTRDACSSTYHEQWGSLIPT